MGNFLRPEIGTAFAVSTLHTFSPASRANCGFEAITGLIIAWNVIIIVATHREKEISTIVPSLVISRDFFPLFAFFEYFSISNGNLSEITHVRFICKTRSFNPTSPHLAPLNYVPLRLSSRHLADRCRVLSEGRGQSVTFSRNTEVNHDKTRRVSRITTKVQGKCVDPWPGAKGKERPIN